MHAIAIRELERSIGSRLRAPRLTLRGPRLHTSHLARLSEGPFVHLSACA